MAGTAAAALPRLDRQSGKVDRLGVRARHARHRLVDNRRGPRLRHRGASAYRCSECEQLVPGHLHRPPKFLPRPRHDRAVAGDEIAPTALAAVIVRWRLCRRRCGGGSCSRRARRLRRHRHDVVACGRRRCRCRRRGFRHRPGVFQPRRPGHPHRRWTEPSISPASMPVARSRGLPWLPAKSARVSNLPA
jgi:hypothetical protein